MCDLIHGSERRLRCTIWCPHYIEILETFTNKLDGETKRVSTQVRLDHVNHVELSVFNCQPETVINCCGQQ